VDDSSVDGRENVALVHKRRNQNSQRLGPELSGDFEELLAGEAWHAFVSDDDVEILILDPGQSLFTTVDARHDEILSEACLEDHAVGRFVVHVEYEQR